MTAKSTRLAKQFQVKKQKEKEQKVMVFTFNHDQIVERHQSDPARSFE